MRPERWWDRDAEQEPHEALWPLMESLYDQQGKEREQDYDDYLSLYHGNTRNGIYGRGSYSTMWWDSDMPSFNVIQACVDTKVAHIIKNRVRPFFLTERGDPELRERALGMGRAVEATFLHSGLWGPLGLDVCLDGNLGDAGGAMITPDFANSRVKVERIFAHQFLVSEREAVHGRPRQGIYRELVDRDVALDFFQDAPAHVLDAIRAAPAAPYEMVQAWTERDGEISDMIVVGTAWHLPSGRVDRKDPATFGKNTDGEYDPNVDPGHDGQRITFIQGAVLDVKPWPYDYFPIAWFKPIKKPTGYWSRGLPETLCGAQMAIHRMNERVDAILHLHARPLLYVWRQAKVNTNKITNEVASIIEGTQPAGQALQYIVPQSVPAEYIARIDKIIAWAEKQAGLSELSIQAAKPPGIEHAPAMQHLSDTESLRHTPAFRAWEEFHTDAARIIVDCYRQLAEYAKDFEVIWGDAKDLRRIRWDEVDIEESRYHLTVWPTNLFAKTPSALLSQLITLVNNGIFTPAEAKLQLADGHADIEALLGDTDSARRNIEKKLAALSAGGTYEEHMPHPHLDLGLAIQMASAKINELEADDADPGKIDQVIQFFEDAESMMLEATAKQAAAEQGVMPPPGGPGPAGALPPPGEVPNAIPEGPLPGMPPPLPGVPEAA